MKKILLNSLVKQLSLTSETPKRANGKLIRDKNNIENRIAREKTSVAGQNLKKFSRILYFYHQRLFYKNKSIEISCPSVCSDESKNATDNSTLESTQDYLISDSLTGRYYTCYSLNKRNVWIKQNILKKHSASLMLALFFLLKGDVEELKICLENIPSFKTHIKKTISYANILLKRIESIKYISNYSTCYTNKKVSIFVRLFFTKHFLVTPCYLIRKYIQK